MMRKTNSFKLAVVAVGMLAIGTVSAQTTTATDLVKQAEAVKSVDNKGTINHVQALNGLTQSTNADNVTTFQLGGTLVAPTTITTDATNYFAIQGVERVEISGANAEVPATVATLGTGGISLMVRDEATGEVKKLLAEDAAKFLSLFNRAIREEGTPTTPGTFAVAGLPLMNPASANAIEAAEAESNIAKLFVYRNGVKLNYGTDFTVPTADEITFTLASAVTDIIEVQFTN
ncbi:hypothetical protein F7651_08510 [Tenacibaculum piscium]|uniref:Uncharacterized protein n=2 Tax=Tenacibaculum piscium TaxID=1458515 RepID=A0A2H1YHJ6_9FLAO|nr:hypothetical protein [Tenacibaculum piscium]SOS74982.1 conserved exported hypothetical protein [Tenacibaculum piscium]